MKDLLVATNNMGKLIEIAELLKDQEIKLYSLRDFKGIAKTIEDGKTFRDNAVKKAREACEFSKLPALADDSGLEVDSLDGYPGVRSSRFAGEDATDEENIVKLLDSLQGVQTDKRTARFRCVMALVTPDGDIFTTEGTCDGLIGEEARGDGGFGYDPVFIVREYGMTFAELSADIKNRISHRGKAIRDMIEVIGEQL